MKTPVKTAGIALLLGAVASFSSGDAAAQAKKPAPVAAAKALAAKAPAPFAKKGAKDDADKVIAIVGAQVYTGEGEPLDDAVVLVSGGKIKAIGKGIAVPAGAETVQAKGMVVTPGLVESLSDVGLRDVDLEPTANDTADEGKDRIRAAVRTADAYNPQSVVIPITRAGGITSVGVVPGGGVISGQSAWADLSGETATDALAATPLALHINLGTRSDPQGGSRGANVRVVREAFDDARAYQKNKAAWERNQSRPFSASRLDLEALTQSLGGKKGSPKVPVVFHVDRAASILTALAVAKEFDLTPVIAGGAEAWKVRTTLAKNKVPVIVSPLLAGPENFDQLGARDDNAALLQKAGVQVAITSGETQNARKLRQAAGNAVRAGMDHTAAIAAITRVPAEALGMADKYGTLAPGKIANLVVWSGDPLEIQTRVVSVYIRGEKQSLVTRQTQLFKKYRGATR
ncbi:MAG: amidohydrolase family protein [Polyangiaceae bacterium]